MDTNVKRLFDAGATGYDRQRRQLIPCFDDFYGMALSLIDTGSPEPRILDLGAGTGLFTGMIVQKYPGAHVTLVDLSDRMLEQARERFGSPDRIHYIIGDYLSITFSEPFDFVVSSLSIHHLPHEGKRELFARIHQWLKDGGLFVNADQVAGRGAANDEYYRRRWLAAIHASGLPMDAINASIERRKLDINARLPDQLEWMEQAGFREVDCVYKYLDFAVFCGRK